MTIYIDMDGVLADWDSGIRKLRGISNINKEYPNKEDRHEFKKELVYKEKFYENLPIMPGAKKMVNFIINNFDNYRILSACGEYATQEVVKQKKKWLNKNFPELADNPIFTLNGKQKGKYATNDSLLIDDRLDSIKSFGTVGHTIQHNSSIDTIKQLGNFMKLNKKTDIKLNEILNEVLITFGKKAYPKFNNIVIIAGGAGSGKSFIKDKLIGIEGYTSNVDDLKSLAVNHPKIKNKLKNLDIDIDNPNLLKNPDNVYKLHAAIKSLGIIDGKMENLYRSVVLTHPDRKPNIIFDVTLSNITKLNEIIKTVDTLGYNKQNIHIVWVINSVEVSIKQNKVRDRVVPEDILIDTHEGVALTMKRIVDMGSEIKKYLDGDIYFVLNNKSENDVTFIAGNNEIGSGYIKKATYIKIKEQGGNIDSSKITKEFLNKIKSYVPKTKTW